MSLTTMSAQAALMIVAVIIIRALAINKLPKTTFLFLWGAILCRLLVPFSIPSPASVLNLARRVPAMEPMVTGGFAGAISPSYTALPDMTPAAQPSISPWVLAWLGGGLVLAGYFLLTYLRCRRVFAASLPAESAYAERWLAAANLRRPLRVRMSDQISAPLTYGILRPVILLPKDTAWADTARLRTILTHELVHIRRFDALTKLVLAAVLCLHWFNPLVWAMYVLANRDLELSCDERVVKVLGDGTKAAYALTLIGMEENRRGLAPLTASFSRYAIKERVQAILKYKKTTVTGVVLAVTLVAGVVTVFATSANTPAKANETDPAQATALAAGAADPFDDGLAETRKAIKPYEPFGLAMSKNPAVAISSFNYNGIPVRELNDDVAKVFITDRLGPDWPLGTVDLYAVYTDGKLTGLRQATQAEYDKRTEERRRYQSEAFAQEEAFVKERNALLLGLRFPGYEDMTIAQFREKVHASVEEAAFLKAYESMSFDESIQTDTADGWFLRNILHPLLAERYQNWTYGGYTNESEGQLEFMISSTITDSGRLTVGAHDRAIRGAMETMRGAMAANATDNRTEEEIWEHLDTVSKETARRYETPGLKLEIDFFYMPPDDNLAAGGAGSGAGMDALSAGIDTLDAPATQEDYALILALMTQGFESRGVDDFRYGLLEQYNTDEERYYTANERMARSVSAGVLPEALTPAQQSFLSLTLPASHAENHAEMQSQRSGALQDPTVTRRIARSRTMVLEGGQEEWAFDFSCQYDIAWKVPDGSSLTVGERDAALAAIAAGLEAYVNGRTEAQLNGGQAAFQAEADRLCKEASSSKITLKVERVQYIAITI